MRKPWETDPALWTNFVVCAAAEGLTLIALLAIAVPLKYVAGQPALVSALGPLHGLAFLAYQYSLLRLFLSDHIGPRQACRGCLSSFLPGGTWLFGKRLERSYVSLG